MRAIVSRILRKSGYPPDKQEKATLTVLEQAELAVPRLGGVRDVRILQGPTTDCRWTGSPERKSTGGLTLIGSDAEGLRNTERDIPCPPIRMTKCRASRSVRLTLICIERLS